jgi:cellulose synthase/poly-beta-1,6-N-acetylglucosamine synthase-like glycosyltransferase
MRNPRVIIAVIFKDMQTEFITETVENCLRLDYPNYGVFLFPDARISFPLVNKKIRIFPTGKATIPVKRNMAVKQITGEADFIAFIDADASPQKDWLKNAVKYFKKAGIAAVGGPNITPARECFLRKISGFVMQQKICFGSGALRHNVCASRYVDELPTCNLIIKSSYARDNLFDERYENAEDMKYCHDITAQGHKIFYACDVIVYHHRKKIILPVARQFHNYGYYRCKAFLNRPAGSKHFLVPTLFLLYLIVSSFAGLFFNGVYPVLAGSLLFYFTVCVISSLFSTGNIIYSLFTSGVIFICHLSYGYGFLICYVRSKINPSRQGGIIKDDNKD